MKLESEVYPEGIEVLGTRDGEYGQILSPSALAFVSDLARTFEARRTELLQTRIRRQEEIHKGVLPDFLTETKHVRESQWRIAGIPEDLLDRRVEITGPAGDRKMVINGLNSGASTFMADFEDANSPTWDNTVLGQLNLRDAIRKTISFTNEQGKEYRLNDSVATLIVRPRGWHLFEKHVLVDGKQISASLFDFGIYLFHNAHELLHRGSGPYFYLPKIESHMEARLWNDVFSFAEGAIGIPHGTIKATVLIETILAAFEMDEILYELRDHAVGLNCGRWDYIFSYIKKFRNLPQFLVPDRSSVTMSAPFMRAYSLLTIRTCHRRKAHAIGGMAAQIPVKGDGVANAEAITKVRLDKLREVSDGHDGTWVAHPALVPVALQVFNEHMPGPNQHHVTREDVEVAQVELLAVPEGSITEAGLRTNITVGIQYIEAWLRGFGAVPLYNLMEDAATAEISRAQVWQWIHHPLGVLPDGRKITRDLVMTMVDEEIAKLTDIYGTHVTHKMRLGEAKQLFLDMATSDTFVDFLTIPGYASLP